MPLNDGEVDLRLVPLKPWDILSKAEIILRNETSKPWLPLARHGQGVQSLAVMFLFRAFVEHLLAEAYESHSQCWLWRNLRRIFILRPRGLCGLM